MPNLRESKKLATRRAMSDAAARLALAGGADAVSVASIADAAGVSPRTFHNYFSSAADALVHFTADVLEEFIEEIPILFPGSHLSQFFENIVMDAVGDEHKELHSIFSLFKVGEAMDNLSHKVEEKKKFEDVTSRLIAAFCARFPEWSLLEMAVILNAFAGAAMIGLKECSRREDAGESLSVAEKKEIVRVAFAAIRAID